MFQAEDPDTKKSITYVIKQGPLDLFKIDPKTGEIKTARGLDYETENQYALVVGTEENPNLRPGATTKVIVMVEVIVIPLNCFHIIVYVFDYVKLLR